MSCYPLRSPEVLSVLSPELIPLVTLVALPTTLASLSIVVCGKVVPVDRAAVRALFTLEAVVATWLATVASVVGVRDAAPVCKVREAADREDWAVTNTVLSVANVTRPSCGAGSAEATVKRHRPTVNVTASFILVMSDTWFCEIVADDLKTRLISFYSDVSHGTKYAKD